MRAPLDALLLTGLLLAPAAAAAQRPAAASRARAVAAPAPERAIRRDLRMTDMIRRAFAAGTRDSTGRPGPRYWQLWVDYTIAAKLDPETALVTGHETATIRNDSDSAMRVLVLRLDQNIFAANVPRAETVTEITDGMKLTRLAVNGAPVDLTAGRTATQITQTSARIPLATPIAGHSTATVEADWMFHVPDATPPERGLRMGRWGHRLFQVAQWYPRVAVFDDLRAGGWDTDPYLGASEFYNNFGHFDVRLDLPAGWLVGATGVLQNPDDVLSPTVRERLSHALESDSQRVIVAADERGAGKATREGDRLVWHFVADTVADVAWAASNEFVWDATRATIPGRGPIPVNLLYLPEHDGYRRTGAYARHALEFYSRLWMPYAFPIFTQVDGPEGGMEYPMFTMSGPGFGVTDHEIGHQWWPMMVGVNETWYGWMDEGFNQYMNIVSGAAFRDTVPRLDGVGQAYGRMSGNEAEGPLMRDANYGGPGYSFQAYGKAPMMLSMLGGIVGDSAVQRAMSAYAHAWRFRHPSPWDYAFFMDRALGRDLDWFWYYWLFTTESVDGSIAGVKTSGGRTTVTIRQDGAMPAPVVLRVELAASGPVIRPMPNSVVRGDTATVTWPADVWFGGSRTFNAVLDLGGRPVTRVTLDPARRFPDHDTTDNVWPRH